jgi:NAD-dependent dihydropyrimidine dehydrogenase PreA subunit
MFVGAKRSAETRSGRDDGAVTMRLDLVGRIASAVDSGPGWGNSRRPSPMTYVIAEPCIGTKDKSCVDVCPVDCIHGADEDPQLYINPEECIDCGACEPACPVTAIFVDYDVPEQWKAYTELNADYFKTGRTAL